jgi:hypothetical protein
VEAQVSAQRSRHGRQHDVVDSTAECVLDRLELAQVAIDPGEATVWTDPLVEPARGRSLQPGAGDRADAPERVADPGRHVPRSAQRGLDAAGDLGGRGGALEHGVGQ